MLVPSIITQRTRTSLIKEIVDRQDSAVSGIHNEAHVPALPDLPFEVWFQIFSRLDAISLLVASRVSRHWTKISSDHTLWRNLCVAHQICLDNEESQAIFAEALAMSIIPGSLYPATSGWKKLFIRHHKNEQRNRVLGKMFWASHEVNALQRFLNLAPAATRPRMLTYGGEAVPCPQCEREKELLAQMEIMMPSSSGLFYMKAHFLRVLCVTHSRSDFALSYTLWTQWHFPRSARSYFTQFNKSLHDTAYTL